MTKRTFNTQNEAYQHLIQVLVQYGIFNEQEVNKAKAFVLESIPTSGRDEFDADDVIAAAQRIEEYIAANPGTPFPGLGTNAGSGEGDQDGGEQLPDALNTQLPDQQNSSTSKWSSVTAPSAGYQADIFLEDKVRDELSQSIARQATAKINKAVVAHAPLTQLKSEKVVPTVSAEKMDEYEKKLVQTKENKAAFETVRQAIASKTPLPVYIAENPGRAIAWEVEYTDTVDGKSQVVNQIVRESDLFGLLATKLALRIPTIDGSVGVEYKQLRTKESDANGASAGSKSAVPQLKFYNKSDALKNEKMYIPANVQDGNKVMEKSIPIELQFEIVTGTKQDGSDMTRKIRVRGKTEKYPVWTRANEKMRQALGEVESTKVLGVATKADEERIINDISNILRAASSNMIKVDNEAFREITRKVKEISINDSTMQTGIASGNL